MECILILFFSAAETLRAALALGADSGIHILTDMRID
jgi:electron transfer flavoprotein alpha/beta subunit